MSSHGVEADLTFTVDDDGRTGAGRVTADGHTVRVELDRPGATLAAVPGSPVAAVRALRAVAGRLGVRIEVHGPRARLGVVEPARTGRRGRLRIGAAGARAGFSWLVGWLRSTVA